MRLLKNLVNRDKVSAKTPPWIVALRIFTAVVAVIGLAHPLFNASYPLMGSGPLIMVIDDDWMAASGWRFRTQNMLRLVDEAERAARPVILLATTPSDPLRPGSLLGPIGPIPATEARRIVQGLAPKPWRADHVAARATLDQLVNLQRSDIVWLSDGFNHGEADRLATRLQQLGTLHIVTDPPDRLPYALLPLDDAATGFVATLRRIESAAVTDKAATVVVRALGKNGQILAQARARFEEGESTASVFLGLPLQVRNRVNRVDIKGASSAGATILLDERWHRKPIGIVVAAANENQEPLLSNLHYLEKALTPKGEVRTGEIEELLSRDLAVMVMADIGRVFGPNLDRLLAWLEKGGILVRFAGSNMAAMTAGVNSTVNPNPLLPVPLRAGGRTLGGALTWEQPAHLKAFVETSPFYGLAVPPDVKVNRQVLAEPGGGLDIKTWARLDDGTPLVTADRRGKGWLVLFHTSAGPAWTNLPFSGLFAEMLGRIVELGQGFAGAMPNRLLQPAASLNGFGELGPADPSALPLRASEAVNTLATPRHPPGFYGLETYRLAVNVTSKDEVMEPLTGIPAGTLWSHYSSSAEMDLKPWLLALALVLILLDSGVTLAMKGLLHPIRRAPARAMGLFLLAAVSGISWWPSTVEAQSADDEFALRATLDTRLAYVITGDPALDQMSEAGLAGLTRVLVARTSVEAAEPLGVDLERHELAFFPLLYWPMSDAQDDLSPKALAKIDRYMKNGGMILFDTRDQRTIGTTLATSSGRSGAETLRRVLARLNPPPLTPIGADHVLNRSFYLISSFPGRWTGGELWVEKNTGRAHRRVASIIVGGNDWAAAWALDMNNKPLVAIVPNSPGQRELSFRFGINLVMYALTGNYKDDQVHLPALIERLGQ